MWQEEISHNDLPLSEVWSVHGELGDLVALNS